MKETLAWELRENGYELLHHYKDYRAVGTRHKIVIAIPRAAFTDRELDSEAVSEIVHKYVPEAEVYGPIGSVGMSFVWIELPTPSQRTSPSIGTDYYTQQRRAYKTLRKMELEQRR